MLVSPCEITSSGTTVRSLASAKIEDTFCIKKHKIVLIKLQEWKKDKQQLYKNNKEK